MTHVLDLMEDAAGTGRIRFLPEGREPLTLREVWERSASAGFDLRSRFGTGATIAMVLATSLPCVVALLGAWRAGLTVASVPRPARGQSSARYGQQVDAMTMDARATGLLLERRDARALARTSVPITCYEDLHLASRQRDDSRSGGFIQFTSGTTRSPRGTMLTLDAIGSNAVAILERLELHEKEVSCSWLPLSHDMGLIGLLVAAWAARGPRWSTTGEGEVILIRPEAFVARPSVWLEACSTFGATFTAAPSSALRLTARILAAGRRPVDLSSIRALITGAEAIRADNLRAFSEAARPAGFDDRAFCPAYGLAEATLAVTLTPPSQHWHSRCTGRRNTGSMHDGLGDATFEVVSSGKPVSGVRVRTSPNGARMGTIEVSSPSLLSGYVGESESPTTNDGWLPTEDIGEIVDDELFVVGRTDDVVSLAGRNVLAPELERIAAEDPAVRGDSCAVTIEDDRLVLVAELGRGVDRSDLPGAARRVRSALLERSGFAPGRVVFVSKSQLPRTPSGKLQRHLIALRLHAGDLPIEFEG